MLARNALRVIAPLLAIAAVAGLAAADDPVPLEDKAVAELTGTYRGDGDEFPGVFRSIALLPGGKLHAEVINECADANCTSFKAKDFTGTWKAAGGSDKSVEMHLIWGNQLGSFKGVIESVGTKYTMFVTDGSPARAAAVLKLKEANKAVLKEKGEAVKKAPKLGRSAEPWCAVAADCGGQNASCSKPWSCTANRCSCAGASQ